MTSTSHDPAAPRTPIPTGARAPQPGSTAAGEVRRALPADLASWRSLAREVEPLFGPMPDIEDYVTRGIERGTAYATGPVGEITGGMLLSRQGKPQHIIWLAVRSTQRGRGHGAALVRAALEHWPVGDVEVVTFAEQLREGRPARHLYESAGFSCVGRTEPGPDGGARDLFVLRRGRGLWTPDGGRRG